ncbi:MAG: response regulator [Candidatus Pacebacteria bacterium]|nr:response regulator [Candidatus Paceibacterota bacterium]
MAKKILLIEDEAALQKSLGGSLTEEGFEVLSALDGEVGERLAKSEKPDLVILDLILPRKDGLEVFQSLKEDESTRDIPVVVLTNLEKIEHVEKVLEMGAKTYLVKANYTLKEIVEKIKQTLASEELKSKNK